MEKKHLCLGGYLILSFLYGTYLSSFGSLIPFFAEITGKDEADFSFIFFVRSFGNILGGFVIKYILTKTQNFHRLLIINLSIIFVFMNCFVISLHPAALIFWVLVSSCCFVCCNIVQVSAIFAVAKKQTGLYLQCIGIMFGAGAMTSPILIGFFHQNTLSYISVFCLIPVIMLFFLESPKLDQEQGQTIKSPLPLKIQILICASIFIYVVEQVGFASWLPTYCLKRGIFSLQNSSTGTSLFWTFNFAFRVIWLFIPGTSTRKYEIVIYLLAISTSLALLMELAGLYTILIYSISILTGSVLANFYCYTLALISENNLKNSPQNNAHIVMAGCISEGIMITPIGYLMNTFGASSLIWIVFLLGLILVWVCRQLMQQLKVCGKKEEQEMELMKN